MKRTLFLTAAAATAFACASAPTALAQSITSVANGEWTSPAVWSDTLAPSSGKNYTVNGFTVDSPVGGSSTSPGSTLTFGGDSITVESGSTLRLRHTSDGGNTFVQYNLKSLTLKDGSTWQSYNTARGNVTRRVNNPVNFESGTVTLRIQSDSSTAYSNQIYLTNTVSGEATINLTGGLAGQTGERRMLWLTGGANTFTGSWNVTGDGGDDSRRLFLVVDAPNALGTGTVSLNTRAQLRVTSNGSINTLAGISLTQASSTLQLQGSGGWNNPSATLDVTAGTISAASNPISLSTYTQAGGTVSLSSLTTVGNCTQTGGTLNLGTTATVGGDFTSGGTIAMTIAPSAPARIGVSGNADVTGAVINTTLSGNPVGQTFNLLSYAGTLTGSPTVNVAGDSGRLTPSVSTGSGTNDAITLTFTGSVANLVWTGGTNSDWNNNTTQNFDNGGSPDVFRSYDNVLFNDGAFVTNPQIVGNLSAGTVTFDGSSGYTLGGTGALVGPTSLVKSGSHVLVIDNTGPNTFTGAITINAGTLQVGSGATTGSLGNGAIANEGEILFNRADGITIPNAISGGGSLVQGGVGTTILTGNNTYSGDTAIDAGTLQIGNGGTTGTIGSGAILNNGTLAINRSNAITLSSDISGSGALSQLGAGTTTVSGSNSYSGITTIAGGTLTTTGGDDRLPTTTTLAFSNTSALALGATSQTVSTISLPVANAASTTTITGAGTLLVNGAVPFNFGPSGSLTAARAASINLTGLSVFEFNAPAQTFRVGTLPGATTSTTNFGTTTFLGAGSTTIKALSFLLGDQGGTGSGGTNTFRLGETSVIHANTINTGASGRSNATLNFNTGLVAPTLTLRGSNGTAPVTSWEVGRVGNFGPGVTTWTANVDLSGGETDALVTTLKIGINNPTAQTNRAGIQNSTFVMGDGTLTVTNLIVGEHAGTGSVSGTYAGNGTFTLSHPDGIVSATSLRLAENVGAVTGAGRSVSGTLNLNDGTLAAGEIRLGNQTAADPAAVTRNFNFSGGTLTHLSGQDLAITDVPVKLTGGGTRVVLAAAGRTITATANSPVTEFGGFSKQGAGSLILLGTNTYSGDTFLDAGTLGGTGSSASVLLAAAGTTVAPGASIGTMATAGATFASGATLAIEIDSDTDTADKLTAAGAVDISGATVTFTEIGSGTIPAGTKLVVLDYTGQSLTGTFSGLSEGATVNVGANSFTLSYTDAQRITLTSTTVGDAYSTWAAGAGLDDSPGKEADFDADPDDDGVANGLEWVLGGNPLAGDSGSLVDVSATATGGLTLEFTRDPASVGVASLFVDFDTDLESPWAKSVSVGPATSGPDANGVVVTITPGTPDDVSVNLPASNAGTEERIFARLRAEKP